MHNTACQPPLIMDTVDSILEILASTTSYKSTWNVNQALSGGKFKSFTIMDHQLELQGMTMV